MSNRIELEASYILEKDYIINDIIKSLESNSLTSFINFNELKF